MDNRAFCFALCPIEVHEDRLTFVDINQGEEQILVKIGERVCPFV